LKDLFSKKNCFKLILGAANTDLYRIERLVAVYAKAGARFFDMAADINAFNAAKKGLDRVVEKEDQNNFYFCASIGVNNDQHLSKIRVDHSSCNLCERCIDLCSYGAISIKRNTLIIDKNLCFGCKKCLAVCDSLSLCSENIEINNILPELIHSGIDCIELHVSGESQNEIFGIWDVLNTIYDGTLSISIGRRDYGDKKLIELIRLMLKDRKPYSTIIQADGMPVSGHDDSYKTTLHSVATGEIIQNANLPAYLILAGGTNSKTAELAHLCGVYPDGIAVGSYARNLIKEFIDEENLFNDEEIFNKAVERERRLIQLKKA